MSDISPKKLLSFLDGEATIASTVVAELFEKRHDNVVEAIRTMLARTEDSAGLLNFKESSYVNQQNKQQPCYNLTRDGFLFLTLGFTGKKADTWRWQVIEAFNKMEEEIRFYQAAKVRLDSPVLVDALFNDGLSVFRARQIQDFTPEEQEEILALPGWLLFLTWLVLSMRIIGGDSFFS